MNYSVRTLYENMGYHWALEDEFFYPMNPRLRYSSRAIRTMRAELQYRLTERENFIGDMQTCNL